jgi:hypothetical protein
LVLRVGGDGEGTEMGLGYPHELSLGTGNVTVLLSVSEQGRPSMKRRVLSHLALGEQLPSAKKAASTSDIERHDDCLTESNGMNLRTDLRDDAVRLVSEDVSGVETRNEVAVEMKIRAAQSRARDTDDRVGRFLDPGIRYVRDLNGVASLPGDRPDRELPSWNRRRGVVRRMSLPAPKRRETIPRARLGKMTGRYIGSLASFLPRFP